MKDKRGSTNIPGQSTSRGRAGTICHATAWFYDSKLLIFVFSFDFYYINKLNDPIVVAEVLFEIGRLYSF